MLRLGNSRLVIWVEKIKNYIRVEPILLTDDEKIDTSVYVARVFRLLENEEKFLFYIIYYLSTRYGIKEIIQSNYLITDNTIYRDYEMKTTKKMFFQNEEIVNIPEIEIYNI